jgi:hypothetical protein
MNLFPVERAVPTETSTSAVNSSQEGPRSMIGRGMWLFETEGTIKE